MPETPKEPKKKNTSKKSALKEATSSVVSPQKQEDKSESKNELLTYLQENFPLITSLILELKQNTETANKDTLSKLSELEKNAVKNKDQNAQIQTKLENSRKILSAIDEKLQQANDQRKQAADLEEERIAEDKKEKAILEEKRAEKEEQQNAEIITKLSGLTESLNNLEITGSSRGGGGLLRSLGGLISGLISSILPLVMSGITAIAGTLGTLFSAVLPVLLPIITTALAGLAGYALFKLVIEPYMEDAAKRIQDKILKLSKPLTTEAVLTDTGEEVYKKYDEQSGKTTAITKSEYEKLPDAEKEQYTPLTKSFDQSGKEIQSPASTVAPVTSGSSLETIQKQLDIQSEVQQGLQENPKSSTSGDIKYIYYQNQIKNFEEEFGSQMMALIDDVRKMEDESFMGEYNPKVWAASLQNVDSVLSSLHTKHINLLGIIRGDKSLTDMQKEQLLNSNPLTFGGLDFDPRYVPLSESSLFTFGEGEYQLPSLVYGTKMTGYVPDGLPEPVYKRRKDKGLPTEPKFGELVPYENRYFDIAALINDRETSAAQLIKNKNIGVPQMKQGGFVQESNSPMGTNINVAEVGTGGEFIIPFHKMDSILEDAIQAKEIGNTVTSSMRQSYFEEKEASQGSQAPLIINNVNNTKGTSGGGDGVNYQFQTDLARTFDTVFEMILEKNMRTGIA